MSHSYNYPPQIAYPSAPPVYRAFPAPPRLHWVWVLVLSIVTFGTFWAVWLVVQARWVKKATGNARPLAWTVAYLTFFCLVMVAAISGSVYFTVIDRHGIYADLDARLANPERLVSFALYIASVYMLKSALERAPIKIRLHGGATLFLGPIYFQYYLRDYSVAGKVGEQLSGFEAADAAAVAEVLGAPPQL